ncbi:MAG: ABC transporter permease [Tannerellaceae bacterium]|jgi:ribose/xylose/arabinose/galactoside ABC-type transport system permease subunit|nr:ABC transporter permease [Tannerellaceae bacterium]
MLQEVDKLTNKAGNLSFPVRIVLMPRPQKVNICVGIVAFIVIVVISITIPSFLTLNNIVNIFEQISTLGFLSIGMTCVLIGGGIDLSTPSILAASAVVGATYMAKGGGAVVGCLLMILVALVFGCINGLAVTKGRMIPFIVTLSTKFVAEGFAVMYINATSVYGLPDSFQRIGSKIGIIPISIFIFLSVAILFHLIIRTTKLGRWYYLIGENENAAKVSGLPVIWAKFSTYVVSSIMAAFAAIILTARLNSATSSMVGETMIMDAISVSVIGGASLNGGKGNVFGTLLGVLFITIISNCTNLLGISYYTGMIIKGIIIVLVIGIDVLRSGGQ